MWGQPQLRAPAAEMPAHPSSSPSQPRCLRAASRFPAGGGAHGACSCPGILRGGGQGEGGGPASVGSEAVPSSTPAAAPSSGSCGALETRGCFADAGGHASARGRLAPVPGARLRAPAVRPHSPKSESPPLVLTGRQHRQTGPWEEATRRAASSRRADARVWGRCPREPTEADACQGARTGK